MMIVHSIVADETSQGFEASPPPKKSLPLKESRPDTTYTEDFCVLWGSCGIACFIYYIIFHIL